MKNYELTNKIVCFAKNCQKGRHEMLKIDGNLFEIVKSG